VKRAAKAKRRARRSPIVIVLVGRQMPKWHRRRVSHLDKGRVVTFDRIPVPCYFRFEHTHPDAHGAFVKVDELHYTWVGVNPWMSVYEDPFNVPFSFAEKRVVVTDARGRTK